MPHSRVSPLEHAVSARNWKVHLAVLWVHDQVSICVGQKITLAHTQAPYILWIFTFFFSLEKFFQPGVVAHDFNPNTQEAETGGSL